MIEVTENLTNLIPNFKELLQYNYVIYAILDKSLKGRVFVDQLPNPRVVVAWDNTDDSGLYLEGPYSSTIAKKINQLIVSDIIPTAIKLDESKDMTCCFAPHDVWIDHMEEEIFKDVPVRHDTRKFFHFEKGKNTILNWKNEFPHHFSVIYYDGLQKEAKSWSGESINLFDFEGFDKIEPLLSNSKDPFACCIIDKEQKKIIARVFTDWNSTNFVETGIQTAEEYRKQGLGSRCAAAMLEFACYRGYKHIGWHCWSENVGSAKTALRAGFEFERNHSVFHLWYNQFDNLMLHLDHLNDEEDGKNTIDVYRILENHISSNSQAYQTSFFRSQPYYERWITHMKLVSCGNAGEDDAAIEALNKLRELKVENLPGVIENLRKKIWNKGLWENSKWKELITSIESTEN
ncbi:GNAT family N-acetyltransferase [Candidatus Lokiarchaeum ossiferum]|uniref:GNAT family N-acetyltransferase n=1 Tax=Candidatus Lokiarchaeum ossiferum TaxID=2951803 RepID=UPI00352D2347